MRATIKEIEEFLGKPTVRRVKCMTPNGGIPVMDNSEQANLLSRRILHYVGSGIFEYSSYENAATYEDVYWNGNLLFKELK